MKVEFTQARSLEGVSYKPGIHEVPDKHQEHWYFKAMLKSGVAKMMNKNAKLTGEVAKRPLKDVHAKIKAARKMAESTMKNAKSKEAQTTKA